MHIRALLKGSTALRAPEDDRGAVDADFQDLDDLVPAETEDLDADPVDPIDDVDVDDQDPLAGADEGHDPPPHRREPSRRERDVIEARRRAQAAEEEVAKIRREVELERQQRHQRETEADFERRLEMMTPEERIEARAARREQTLQARLDRMEFDVKDRTDKAEFDALCVRNKAYASVQDRVEQLLKEIRAGGVNVSRQIIAEREIGRLAVERANKARPKAQREAAAARARETARPAGARSDTRGTDSRNLTGIAAVRARLEGKSI